MPPPPPLSPPPLPLVQATASTITATAPASHQRFIPHLPFVPAFVPRSSGFRCARSRSVTSSPSRSQRGGVRAIPTPGGVPVAMRSPGSSVIVRLMKATRLATPKTMWAVDESCKTSPFTQQRMSRACGSGISSGRHEPGSAGQERVDGLPQHPLARPRLEVARRDVVHARVPGHVVERVGLVHQACARRPITTPSSAS